MIQPNKLRIGNYVDSHKGYTKVVGVLCDMIETETHSDILDNFDPIPITPKILDRLDGFFVDDMNYNENKENYCMCVYEGTYLHINSKNGVTKIGSHEHSADVGIGTIDTTFYIQDTKHLHQLQNLIFALSGIELTFKTN